MQKETTKDCGQLLIKSLFIVSMLCVLTSTSCTDKNQRSLKEIPNTNNDNTRHDSLEACDMDDKHEAFLNFIEHMKEFYADEIEALKMLIEAKANDHENYKPGWLFNLQQAGTRLNDSLEELTKNITSDSLKDKKKVNAFLKRLLKRRIEILQERNTDIRNSLAPDEENPYLPTELPASRDFFDFVIKDDMFSKTQEYYKFQRFYKMSMFEILQLFITIFFENCSLEDLDAETINLLRASVQLHPILTGERKDLGHPDEAGGAYAILEPIIMPEKANTKQSLPACQAIAADYQVRFSQKVQVELRISENFELVRHLNKMFILQSIKEPQLAQEVLSFRKNLDLDIWEAHFVSKEEIIEPKEVPAEEVPAEYVTGNKTQAKLRKKLLKKQADLSAKPLLKKQTDYEAGKWPFPLPSPSFLIKQSLIRKDFLPIHTSNKKKSNPQQKLKCAKKSSQLLKKKPIRQEEVTPVDNWNMDQKEELIQEGQAIARESQEMPQMVAKQTQQPEVDAKSTKQPLSEINEQDKLNEEGNLVIKESKQEEESSIQKDKQESEPISKKEEITQKSADIFSLEARILPRGSRVFHSHRPLNTYPTPTINNRQQKNVDDFFDIKKQASLTFGDFKKAWSAAGGTIGQGHGSHRALFDATGKRVSYGICGSGDNHTYRRSSIKYIQEALLAIGLVPSKWIKPTTD